jgi:hypothetical protein
MLTDEQVDEAYNIAVSRAVLMTKKGHNVIHNKLNELHEDDIKNIGYVLIPGVDAINHESMVPSHPDVKDTQISYVKDKVVVKAGRDFKKGEEFYINYNSFGTVYEIFKSYG